MNVIKGLPKKLQADAFATALLASAPEAPVHGKVPAGYAQYAEALGVLPGNYVTAVRDYANTLTMLLDVTDLNAAFQDLDCLAFYVDFRETAARLDGRVLRSWKSTTRADALSLIPTALAYFGLPRPLAPSTSIRRLRRAASVRSPHEGVDSRTALPMRVAATAKQRLLDEKTGTGTRAAALLDMMILNLMRPSDVDAIGDWSAIERSATQITIKVHDKTHKRLFRTLILMASKAPSLRFDSTDSYDTIQREAARGSLRAVFGSEIKRKVRGALQSIERGSTLGRVRPLGVCVHLHLQTPIPIMKKLAGWSADSQVWMDHYMDMGALASLASGSAARAPFSM